MHGNLLQDFDYAGDGLIERFAVGIAACEGRGLPWSRHPSLRGRQRLIPQVSSLSRAAGAVSTLDRRQPIDIRYSAADLIMRTGPSRPEGSRGESAR
jgi:hypothetical protein